jgi:hypothetical protein
VTDAAEPKTVAEKVREALEDGLLLLFRIKNSKVDYSIMNRPEPTTSGVDDHALATAIVHAGRHFEVKRTPRSKSRERVSRSDGRDVTYKESIDIDWTAGTIQSTRGKDLTLQVLGVIVNNLMADAQRQAVSTRNKHGLN